MKLIGSLVLLLALARVHSLAENNKTESTKIRYDGYSVYRISLTNEIQSRIFRHLPDNGIDFSEWRNIGDEVHLMVSPKQQKYLQFLIKTTGVNAEVMIPDVQKLIDEEQGPVPYSTETLDWLHYHDLNVIYSWLDGILAEYPSVTESFVMGKSYEGRDIRGIKISNKANQPGIFIDSTIHSSEWITAATVTWFINELLSSSDPNVRQLAESYDWYIVPVVNVDGYQYTHTTDRLWRKTRQPYEGTDCIGADPNRNFDNQWMVNDGAKDDPCSIHYAGPQPFSEPEVKALADFIYPMRDRINMLFSFHSYSQLVLIPYGYTTEEEPSNYDDLMRTSKAYVDAVAAMSYGNVFKYGPPPQLLYVASGISTDWAYQSMDIKLAYTLEFRDTGRYGMVLPPVNILPNCEETMVGIQALVKEAETLGYMQPKYLN